MKRIGRIRYAVLVAILVVVAVPACKKNAEEPAVSYNVTSPFASFLDIPGVTAEEITAIEKLRGEYDHFVYGINHTTEAFPIYSGEDGIYDRGKQPIGGYAAHLCAELTMLFDIPFKPVIYGWSDFLLGLENGEIHFTGDLTLTEERGKTYFMTDAITERLVKSFQMAGTPSIAEILKTRPPRLAVPHGFAPFDFVKSIVEYDFEPVFINDYADAYRALKSGEADVFLTMDIAESAFDIYSDIVYETFYPLVFVSASLSTRTPELKPVISVMQKVLENGGASYLAGLYGKGRHDYIKNKFLERLTPEELEYIRNKAVVKIATESDSYPLSFYNNNDKEYQGIAFDIIREIELISGLSFEVANAQDAPYLDLINMVEDGDASIITAMMRSRKRESHFLLAETPLMKEHPVLISRSEFPKVQFNELANVRVGVVRGTTHAELFKQWFPNNRSLKEYDSLDGVFYALDRREVDMFMSMSNYLLSIENYKEFSDFKTNVKFDNDFEITFGFNRNEAVLCSIVDKALRLIDREGISGYWANKRYDYRVKVAEARLPLLIGATTLSLITLALILILFMRNRNEGKRLEQLVAEKTSTLTAILDATPDLIFCKDVYSNITECNKAMERYYNVNKADIIGKNDAEVLKMPPELGAHYAAVDNKIFSEKQSITVEEFIPASDGKMLLFETIKTPLIQNGEVSGLVGMSRDITQRKAIEQEARNASEAKSHFLANMSHEMRTPMNVIVGLTDLMLEETDVPGAIKKTLKKINTAGNTLMDLINDILDISKIEAGKLELTPVQYDLASLLNDIITLNTIRIQEKPITFKLDINENLPCSLFGDDLRVKQILNNLLSNAFKYTKKGSVTLGVDSCREGAHASGDGANSSVLICFSISDTGIGIHKEDVAKLFSDYNQVDTRANRKIEGTGLGLSITKKFVELMDGDITVESEYGKGTTFRVHIRQGFVTDTPIGRKTVESLCSFNYSDTKKGAGEKLVRPDLSYARVLVVDDFPTNLDVAEGMLRKYKMQVDCVTNGQEAIDLIAAREQVYDAIFMDHMMPELDGVQTTTVIRMLGNDYARNIPIIALTANAVAGSEQMFLNSGFNAFLPKPFNVKILDAIIQRWVRDKSRE